MCGGGCTERQSGGVETEMSVKKRGRKDWFEVRRTGKEGEDLPEVLDE